MSDLRPDLEIEQKFEPAAIVVQDSNNPLILIGVNRQIEWREDAGDYIGGQANPVYSFPNLIAGSKVEQPAATEVELRPHVFISNRFGMAEVAPTYDFVSSPPTFSLSPTLFAVFEISSGVTGEYAASSGKFTDDNADFIEDEVATGDVIKVDGIAVFDIDTIVSDTELDVTKKDKASGTWSGDLSIEDANSDRVFTDLAFDFEAAGVAVGDIVMVEGWDIVAIGDGIDYAAEVGGVRIITAGLGHDFVSSGVSPPVTGPPYEVDIIWIQDSGLDWIPALKVDANVTAATLDAVDLITSPQWPEPTASESDKVFEIFHYESIDLATSVWTDDNGEYTAEVAGQRTFTIGGGNPNAIDLTTLSLVPGQHQVVVHGIMDAGGTPAARPIFKIISVDDATNLTVENWDPDRPLAASTGTGETWEIWNDAGTPVMSFLGASVSIEDDTGCPLGERYFVSTVDLETAGVLVGDTVYSAAGVSMFEVTTVGANGNPGHPGDLSEFELYVKNLVSGTPPSSWTDPNFAFYIAAQTEADLLVTRIVDENTLTVRNVLASTPPEASAFADLLYAIVVADSLSSLDYTIEKTLSGTGLTGDVLCTYTARRNDYYSAPFDVDDDDWETKLGDGVPANPLGLAASIAVQNTNYPVWCLQVPNDLSQDWINALNYLKAEKYYNLCPLTQIETVLASYRAHTLEQSMPEVKRDRIFFQSHDFDRIEERTTGSTSTFEKTSTTTTVTIAGDVSAYGVVVGDVMKGTADVEGTEYTFSARIISLTTGATSILIVVNDNGIGGSPPVTGTIDDWTIESKELTDLQYAQKIAAYPLTIANRRFRNVWPDECQVQFSDKTDPSLISGLYGGGDVIWTVGGHFQAAMFASLRSGQKPSQALTKVGGVGIYRVLNPFGDFWGGDEDLNDVILNGGNWVASQAIVGGEVSAGRAITTDVSEIKKLEDSVTYQVDNFARMLRKQIKPLLGPFNIEGTFFDMVSTNVEAVREKVVNSDKDMKFIEFLDIRESEDILDTFEMDFYTEPFISAARSKVTIFV